MKITTVIDKGREEEIVIYTSVDTDTVERVRALFEEKEELVGYRGEEITLLDVGRVYCFYTEDGRSYAVTEGGRYLVRLPLYRLEELMGEGGVRINQSCIVARDAVLGFSASIGGGLAVTVKGGYSDYVSRRQVKSVKERFGIK